MTDSPDTDIANAERAERFDQALTRYNDEYDTAANLIDLLADARHWCDRHGQCYGDLDRLAHDHYLAELWIAAVQFPVYMRRRLRHARICNCTESRIVCHRLGFTLIELSIVLIIIGLITGGVLVGRDLVKTATLRSACAQIEQAQAAIAVFRERYQGMPGDIPTASALWTGAIDGNGNGIFDGVESYNTWNHLALASLFPNASTPVAALPEPASWEPARSKINNTFLHMVNDATFTTNILRNHLTLTMLKTPTATSDYLNQLLAQYGITPIGLVPYDAWFIDNKIDDGAPLSGRAASAVGQQGDDDMMSCPSPTGDNAYNLKSTWGVCGLWMNIIHGG